MIFNNSSFGNVIQNLPDKLTQHLSGLTLSGVLSGFNIQATQDLGSSGFKIYVSGVNINSYDDIQYTTTYETFGSDVAEVGETDVTAPADLNIGQRPLAVQNSANIDFFGHSLRVNIGETLPYINSEYVIPEDIISLIAFYNNDNILAEFDLTDYLESSFLTDHTVFITVWLGISYNGLSSKLEYKIIIDDIPQSNNTFVITAANVALSPFANINHFKSYATNLQSPIAVKITDNYPAYINDTTTPFPLRDYRSDAYAPLINISMFNPTFDLIILSKIFELIMYKTSYYAKIQYLHSPRAATWQYIPIGLIMIPPHAGAGSTAYQRITNVPDDYITVEHGLVTGTTVYNPWDTSLLRWMTPTTTGEVIIDDYRYVPIIEDSLVISVLHDLSEKWFKIASYDSALSLAVETSI